MDLRRGAFDCIFLELTNRCNFNCAFCPNACMTRKRGTMDEALARRLIDEIAREGLCRWISFSLMGEPMLHPKILDIAGYAVERGLRVHIITNYSLLSTERLEALLTLPVASITLSLQVTHSEDHDRKGAAKSFSFDDSAAKVDETVRAKARLHSPTKIEIHLLTTRLERPRGIALLEGTGERLAVARRFRAMAAVWAKDLGLPPPPKPPPFEGLRYWLAREGQVPLLSEVTLFFKRATLWANTLLVDGVEVEEREAGTCQLAQDTLGILWDGRVTVCCLDYDGKLALGSVADGSITQVLASERYGAMRKAFEEGRLPHPYCRRCRGKVVGPRAKELLPGSLPALVGEGWGYLRRFGLRKTLERIPQELARYFGRGERPSS